MSYRMLCTWQIFEKGDYLQLLYPKRGRHRQLKASLALGNSSDISSGEDALSVAYDAEAQRMMRLNTTIE